MTESVKVTANDLHWTAGFLEGEGSFLKCGGTIVIVATQVQKQPLEKLVSIFGGSLNRYSSKKVNTSDFYRWNLYGRKAERLMALLYSLMSPKRQDQISKALSWYSARPGKNFIKSGRVYCRKGHPWKPKNIYIFPKTGHKVCSICKLDYQRKFYRSRTRNRVSSLIS